VTIVSIDSSGAAKLRVLDLNSLRNAQITGNTSAQDKSQQDVSSDTDHGSKQPSFEDLLNKVINERMVLEKETQKVHAEQQFSQLGQQQQRGPRDGFNRGGGDSSEWGPDQI